MSDPLPRPVSAAAWEATARAALQAGEGAEAADRARDPLLNPRWHVEFGGHDFQGPDGRRSLLDLFEGRDQLLVYHLRHGPVACPGCAYFVDNLGDLVHLHDRGTTLVLVSPAPWADLDALRTRTGWRVPLYSAAGTDFAEDCGAGEGVGLSVFLRHGDRVFRLPLPADGELTPGPQPSVHPAAEPPAPPHLSS